MPRETEKHKQKIFHPSNVDSRCKCDNGKGMQGGHQEGTQKTKDKESPLCCIDGDIRHIQKYEYIPVNVRKNNISSVDISTSTSLGMFERGIPSVEIIKDEGAVHELRQEIDEAGIRAEKLF